MFEEGKKGPESSNWVLSLGKRQTHICLELGLTPLVSYPPFLHKILFPVVSAGLPVKKSYCWSWVRGIHPMHKASKLWESATSLLLSCVPALSLLLEKLDYDFTRDCLLKFLSFLCCHKNSQKSNNFGKDNGVKTFSRLKQHFETKFTYIYFHWNNISLDAFYFEWNRYLITKMR